MKVYTLMENFYLVNYKEGKRNMSIVNFKSLSYEAKTPSRYLPLYRIYLEEEYC